jgi:hypothetical protein
MGVISHRVAHIYLYMSPHTHTHTTSFPYTHNTPPPPSKNVVSLRNTTHIHFLIIPLSPHSHISSTTKHTHTHTLLHASKMLKSSAALSLWRDPFTLSYLSGYYMYGMNRLLATRQPLSAFHKFIKTIVPF